MPGTAAADVRGITGVATLTRRGLGDAEAHIRLDGEQTELVAGRLTVSAWWDDRVLEVVVPPTVVLSAAPRIQAVGFRAPLIPGPYDLTASFESYAGDTMSADATAWLWNPLATFIVLVFVSVIAVVARMALGRH